LVTSVSNDSFSYPKSYTIEYKVFGLSTTPFKLSLLLQAGEKGSSRYSYHCMQLTASINNNQLMSFEEIELAGYAGSKWGTVHKLNRFLSSDPIPAFGNIPSGFCVSLFALLVNPNVEVEYVQYLRSSLHTGSNHTAYYDNVL